MAMKFEDYERRLWSDYEKFAETVAAIVRSAIVEAGGYRLQQMMWRAKSAASLRKKLEKRGVDLATADELEEEIKDLAGCRIIFYTNSDVTNLINSGLISKNFEVIETKLHHPRRETEDAAELYISNHYLVRLRQERIGLPEYAAFAGMRCEIQVQTILNHAWAEMAHDTIYKAPDLGSFGNKALDSIKSRMAKISRRYLVPAGYEFSKVAADFERLMRGDELFKGEALQAIIEASDNNERVKALETFAESVLPLYDDATPEFPDILAALREAASRARKVESKPISTPYGDLPAKTHVDVLRKIAEIIGNCRYVNPEATLETLFELYADATDEGERKPIVEAAIRLAKHDLAVWRHAGPVVQRMIVEEIDHLGQTERRPLRQLLVAILKAVLGTEVSGSTSTSDTITLHSGPVVASKGLTEMRRKATALLKSLYPFAENDIERGAVLSALDTATHSPPMAATYGGPDLVKDLMESTAEFVEFEASEAPTMSWELWQRQECKVLRHARNVRNLPADLIAIDGVEDMQRRVIAAITAFRQTVDADAEYAIYKVLVGFDVVYPPSWDTDQFDYKEEQTYREREIEKMVAELAPENAKAWHARVIRCASTQSNDLATFLMLSRFLERAGEAKPDIVLGWLDPLVGPLPRFMAPMLRGLQKANQIADANALIHRWIGEGHWLSQIAWFEQHAIPFDEAILTCVVQKAIEVDDREALRMAMLASERQFTDHPGELITNVFMPILNHMAAVEDTSWVGRGWHETALIEALTEEQADAVLFALRPVPKIDTGAARVVTAIAKHWPLCVLAFFDARDITSASEGCPDDYRTLPSSIKDGMRDALAAYPDDILAVARHWFDRNPTFFKYYGGRFIAGVFPGMTEPLEEKLRSIVTDGMRDDIAFVVAILNGYKGSDCIHSLVRTTIARLDPDDDIREAIIGALFPSGIVSGEFGFVERYESLLAQIRPWLDDNSPRVRAFAGEYIRRLERAITSETRRAEAEQAERRLEFDEDPE